MTQTLTKQEKLVLAGVVVCCVGIASFIANFQIFPQAQSTIETVINYKMGKATEEISAYTLEGREIDRTVEKVQSEEGFIAKAVRKISNLVTGKKDKKAVKKAAQKSQAVKMAPRTQPLDPALRPQKATAQKEQKAEFETAQNQNLNTQAFTVAPQQVEQPTAQNNAKEQEKKVKKSFEQIKTEFLAAPSKEAMVALVNSMKKDEVNAADFYQLQSELLESQNDALIGHAIYGLRLSPSVESFSMMAQYQQSAKPAYQTYIEEALLAYNQASQINVIQSVIRSNDKVIVLKAAQVAEAGIAGIRSGDLSQFVDNRNRRDTQSGLSLQNYLTLLPAITQALASSQDSEITASLQELQTLINESNTQVAANP
jgi:hypothetical protein